MGIGYQQRGGGGGRGVIPLPTPPPKKKILLSEGPFTKISKKMFKNLYINLTWVVVGGGSELSFQRPQSKIKFFIEI
jgi:hypothetical protein